MPAIPEKPSLDGLEDKWAARWEAEGTYRFDRSRTRGPRPTARRRWLQHKLRALMDHTIRWAEHTRAERLDHELQKAGDKPVRQIREDFRKAVFDRLEAARHAPFKRSNIQI